MTTDADPFERTPIMQSVSPNPIPFLQLAWRLVLTGLLLLLAPGAQAQERAGRFELGLDLGAIDFDGRAGDDTDAVFRLRGGYFFTERLELEGQAFTTANVLGGDLETWMLNVVYGLTDNPRIQPYVLGGVGAATFERSGGLFGPRVRIDEDGFAYQAGLGSRFAFTRSGRFGGRLEVSVLHEDTLGDATHLIGTAGLLVTLGG